MAATLRKADEVLRETAVVRSMRKGWKFAGWVASIARSDTATTGPATSCMSAKGVTDPGGTRSASTNHSGGAEGKARGAERFRERIEIDAQVFPRDQQPQPPFYPRGRDSWYAFRKRPAQISRFFDPEHRRMGVWVHRTIPSAAKWV